MAVFYERDFAAEIVGESSLILIRISFLNLCPGTQACYYNAKNNNKTSVRALMRIWVLLPLPPPPQLMLCWLKIVSNYLLELK